MKNTDFTSDSPGRLQEIQGSDGLITFVPFDVADDIALTPEVIAAHEKAVLALGALGAIIPSLPRPGLITRPFLTREAVLSSRIEGTKTDVDQIYLFELSDRQESLDDTEEIKDAREVQNYLQAISYGLDQLKTRPIHARLLKETHEILLKGVRGEGKAPGHYRWKLAYVGGTSVDNARYVAPPGETVDKLMSSLEKYINEPTSTLPALIRVAQIHYQFEAIHPFNDGNGRLGRLLISLALSAYGLLEEPFLYLSAYFERNHENYTEHLWQVSRCGAWNNWFLFFLNGVAEESHDAAHRSRQLLERREKYRAEFHSSRASARLLELVDSLFMYPAVAISDVASLLNMSFKGASRYVDQLVEVGLLREATNKQRNRIFVAEPVIELLR
ncbi:MAG TPA: Fic family protein [Pirellulaceae bacterium]|nr:Fic family protein [Pirellulaceae bacterium]